MGLAVKPGRAVIGLGIVELAAAAVRFRGGLLAATAGGLGGAGPVGLGEHRVEGLDVGLDRRRDDVRAPGPAVVQAGRARGLPGRWLDGDDDEALRFGTLRERVDVVADEPRMALEHV